MQKKKQQQQQSHTFWDALNEGVVDDSDNKEYTFREKK